jgi:hypothetical protein
LIYATLNSNIRRGISSVFRRPHARAVSILATKDELAQKHNNILRGIASFFRCPNARAKDAPTNEIAT